MGFCVELAMVCRSDQADDYYKLGLYEIMQPSVAKNGPSRNAITVAKLNRGTTVHVVEASSTIHIMIFMDHPIMH